MMRIFFIIVIAFGVFTATNLFAEEKSSILEGIESESFTLPNPFKSKLPEIKEEPVTIRPPEQGPITPIVKPLSIEIPLQVLPGGTAEAGPALPPFTITGVIWNSDRPQAIINGQVVDVGDTVSNTKIVAIKKDGIDVLVEGVTMTIDTP
jgi:hypothetical protein